MENIIVPLVVDNVGDDLRGVSEAAARHVVAEGEGRVDGLVDAQEVCRRAGEGCAGACCWWWWLGGGRRGVLRRVEGRERSWSAGGGTGGIEDRGEGAWGTWRRGGRLERRVGGRYWHGGGVRRAGRRGGRRGEEAKGGLGGGGGAGHWGEGGCGLKVPLWASFGGAGE